jgi:hypothetical protein
MVTHGKFGPIVDLRLLRLTTMVSLEQVGSIACLTILGLAKMVSLARIVSLAHMVKLEEISAITSEYKLIALS